MNKFKMIAVTAALVGSVVAVNAQDFVVVRGLNEWRAGYAFKIKDVELFGQKATLNAWALTSVNVRRPSGYSFADVGSVYPGIGLHFPVYSKGNSTIGIAAGWSGDATNLTDALNKGQWGVGAFIRVKF